MQNHKRKLTVGAMGKNILKTESYAFIIKIVKLSRGLVTDQKENVISKQILRSGTAIGALIREAEFAQSKRILLIK